MFKKGVLIYNAYSGAKKFPEYLDLIIQKFQKRNMIIQPIRLEKDGKNLDKILKNLDFSFALLSGGDGSVNIGLNGLLKNGINVPVGIFPAGTSNDFARCLNLPNNINKCIDKILEGKIQKVDVGLINNDRYFLSSFAMGMFAGISFDTDSNLKENFGILAYYLKSISEIINISSFKLSLKTNEESYEGEAFLVLIINGKHAAGFNHLIKSAEFSDGKMDIIVIKNCQHFDLTKMFFNLISSNLVNDENVLVFKSEKCHIDKIEKDVAVSVDGEKYLNSNINIEFLKEKISVYV